ncbi:hypothetical protein [Escherichia albertii]|uniref:hypothetical protein n=1 Tax=Escherichia albertii TaxID=208962 RepID=UPI0010F74431|nr:hypothetical protein [Escherichia albertii]
MKTIIDILLVFCGCLFVYAILCILFIMIPLRIEPETIKCRKELIDILGAPTQSYSVKNFVAWSGNGSVFISVVEYRDNGTVSSSNSIKVGNIQLLKKTKVWDGKDLYHYITIWPCSRIQL